MNKIDKFIRSKLAAFYVQYITRILNGVVILVLLPLFLTSEEIGLWFSIFALGFAANIADAGFTNIVLINVAKEKVDSSGNLQQFLAYISFTKRRIVFLYAPILFLITTTIFIKITPSETYIIIWIAYFTGTILMLLNSINLSILEGLGFVLTTTWIRTAIPIVNTVIICLCLTFNFGIWSLSCAILAQWFISKLLLSIMLKRHDVVIAMPPSSEFYRRSSIQNLMKRYGISWLSGYLQNHGIVPILALTNGLVLSGQVGILYNILRLSFGFSQVLVRKNLQEYSTNMIIHGYNKSKKIFIKDAVKSILAFSLFLAILNISIFLFRSLQIGQVSEYSNALPDFSLTLLSSLLWLLLGIVGIFALFFRTAGEEPYAVLGLIINTINSLILYFQMLVDISIYEVYLTMCVITTIYASLFMVKMRKRKV